MVSETNNNRMVLLLIAGIPLTMVLAATWLWFYVASGELDLVSAVGTANRGTLVDPPRQVDDVVLSVGAAPSPYSELEPKWTLAIPWGAKTCDESCEKTLYVTRQIHTAMGKNFNRIQRLWLSDSLPSDIGLGFTALSDERPLPESFSKLLTQEHRRLRAYNLQSSDFSGLFAEWYVDNSTWYLIDPRGWIMMSYNEDIPYKDVISDLKFLLKNSSG